MADEPKEKSGDEKPTAVATDPKSVVGDIDPDVLKKIAETFASIKLPDFSMLSTFKIPEITLPSIDTSLLTSYRTFEDQLVALRKRVEDQTRALREEKSSGKEKEQKITTLESTLDELRAKERIGFLLSRVNQPAQRQLLASDGNGVRHNNQYSLDIDPRFLLIL